MAERRTMEKAMEMTPAMKAFINGEPKPDAKSAATEVGTKTIEMEVATKLPEAKKDSNARAVRRTSRRPPVDSLDAGDVLDQVLVPVTIRLPHRIAQALRRAHLEQRLKHARPATQQEIAEDAISSWLVSHGYLD